MKKLLLVISLLVIAAASFGCGSGGTSTTTNPADSIKEGDKSTSKVQLTTTTTETGGTVAAASVTSVSVIAEKETVAVGDTFEVVVALDVLDQITHGAQCSLEWSPAGLAECTDVKDGEFFTGFETVHVGSSGVKAVDNDLGTVDSIGQFCTGASVEEGGTGQGILFIFDFTAVEAGEVTFSVPAELLVIGDAYGDGVIPVETIHSATVVIE